MPTVFPTTTIPSAVPSETGFITHMSFVNVAKGQIPASEINEIESKLSDIFQTDEIVTDVTYTTDGTITVSNPNKLSNKEVESNIQDALMNLLNIHEKDIVVKYDPDTNTVEYSVISDNYDDAMEDLTAIEGKFLH